MTSAVNRLLQCAWEVYRHGCLSITNNHSPCVQQRELLLNTESAASPRQPLPCGRCSSPKDRVVTAAVQMSTAGGVDKKVAYCS